MEEKEALQKATWKNQALLERVRDLTTQYENQLADARVEVTYVSAQLQETTKRIKELENPEDVQTPEEDDPTTK